MNTFSLKVNETTICFTSFRVLLFQHPVDDRDGLVELRVVPEQEGEEGEPGHLDVHRVRHRRPRVALLEVLERQLPPLLPVLDLRDRVQQPESLEHLRDLK